MSENQNAPPKFLFGYEAQKIVLEALGIDVEAKKFAIQHISIELGFQQFPFITMVLAPYAELFNEPRFKELLAKSDIATINPALFEKIGEKIRDEIAEILGNVNQIQEVKKQSE